MMSKTAPMHWICLIGCLLVVILVFCHTLDRDLGRIFKKDLYGHDESVNAVVAANLIRKFFPAMVRVNPLIEQQGPWMEGPHWQHIPPLFAYVPYLFFKLDAKVTIEIRRLAYALISLATCLLFTLGMFRLSAEIRTTFSAAAAGVVFLTTPFSRSLVKGTVFGTSDIVLAFTVTCAFIAVGTYLCASSRQNNKTPLFVLIAIAAVVSLPIMTKNVLGAIPGFTFFVLLLADRKKIDAQICAAAGVFTILLLIYFGSLYISSPEAFKKEIFISFSHMEDFEGWARPWHYHLSHYLPEYYAQRYTYLLAMGMVLSAYLLITRRYELREQKLLWLSFIWFWGTLGAVSLIRSKAPNAFYQSYLLGLFFAIYPVWWFGAKIVPMIGKIGNRQDRPQKRQRAGFVAYGILFILAIAVATYCVKLGARFQSMRAADYAYASTHEKFYQFAEMMQDRGAGIDDIFILNTSADDCWFRYYLLFLTGAEARTLTEMMRIEGVAEAIDDKYRQLHLVSEDRLQLPADADRWQIKKIGDNWLYSTRTPIADPQLTNTLARAVEAAGSTIYPAEKSCPWLRQR